MSNLLEAKNLSKFYKEGNDEIKAVKDGILGDIAPTILDIMGIEKPEIMTQHSLI